MNLSERDRRSIWHPFTQMQTEKNAISIVRGEGAYLYDENGNKYLDAVSSWWVNLHGHSHPYIADRICKQAQKLEHVIFAGFTHAPAIELAEKLLFLLPKNISKVFYADNGSTAVEVALKMALQYFYNQNPQTKKKKFICFKGSYHGDTFGAMSVAGNNPFTKPFQSLFFDVEEIDPPIKGKESESLVQLNRILSNEDIAGFIFEPFLLGVGGMIIYPLEGLIPLLKTCREHHVILIADEVLTGFGRLGPLFACEGMMETPDIICLAKGITGGFLPLGVTACKEYIYEGFLSDDKPHALLHGHSYTANPIACAAALANLDLLLEKKCERQRKKINALHVVFCSKLSQHPFLKRCDVIGTILVLEFNTESSYFHSICEELKFFFLNRGIIFRPLGNVLYILPPYCISKEDLDFIYEQIVCFLERDHEKFYFIQK